ncbi:MAG: T9SS type A sorting domain-containing protein [Chitinophagaceae bacterium]|nr:T9SS type A sorting domain-containing protein [Chitinophagaceae bacterium]
MKLRKFTFLFFGLAAAFVTLKSEKTGMTDVDRTSSSTGMNSCGGSGCHSATSSSGNLVVLVYDQSNNIVSSYIPGQKYTVNIVYTTTNSSNSAGFQSVVLSAANVTPGTTAADVQTAMTKTANLSGKTLVTHKTDDVTSIKTGNEIRWKYSWTAPATGVADVNVYAIINDANGNNASSGDQIFSASTLLQQGTTTGVEMMNVNMINNVYPNPSSDFLNVTLAQNKPSMVRLTDLNGKVVYTQHFQSSPFQIPVQHLAAGQYVLSVNCDGQKAVKTITKK